MIFNFVLTLIVSAPSHAGTCERDFSAVTSLHQHQREALTKASAGGFLIRVFTKTVAGVVRTVVLAGRGFVNSEEHMVAGYALRTAYPEIGVTRTFDDPGSKVSFPPRPEGLKREIRTRDIVRASHRYLEAQIEAGSFTRAEVIELVKAKKFSPKVEAKLGKTRVFNDDFRALLIKRLEGKAKPELNAVEQITYDVEGTYEPFSRVRATQFGKRFSRRVAALVRQATFFLAGGLIGSGTAVALFHDTRGAWVMLAGTGLLGVHAGLSYFLRQTAQVRDERRERNATVAREIEKVFLADADVTEMLTLVEQPRAGGLAEALARAGFSEFKPTSAK